MHPQTHDAVRSYEDTLIRKGTRPEPLPPVPQGDPVRTFEGIGRQIQADLRAWMTYPLKERASRILTFAAVPPEPNPPTDDEMKRWQALKRQRWLALNYIIQEETRHPDGAREICQAALNLLLPGKKP